MAEWLPFSWCSPTQPGKPSIVTIQSDPLASRFDREGGKPGIGNQVASSVPLNAEAAKQIPVSRTRAYEKAMGLSEDQLAKLKDLLQFARLCKNAGMRRDSNNPRQHLRRHPVAGRTVDGLIKPLPAGPMISRI